MFNHDPQGTRHNFAEHILSPATVGDLKISPKYIGYQRLVEIAISTLVTDPWDLHLAQQHSSEPGSSTEGARP